MYVNATQLEQLPELLNREAGITDDTAHGEGIDRVVTGNGENTLPIGHYDVLALARDPETGLFERAHCIEVIDSGQLRQRYTVISTSRTSSPRSCS